MVIVVIANTLVLLLIIYKISRLRNNNHSILEEVKVGVRSSLVLLPILGITWVVGLASVNSDTVVFQYLFSLMNGLQGFMITLLHCILNSEVKKSLRRIFEVWIRYYQVEKYFDVRRRTTLPTQSTTLSLKDSPALNRRCVIEHKHFHSDLHGSKTNDLTAKVVTIMNHQNEKQDALPSSAPVHISRVFVHPTRRCSPCLKRNEEVGELCGRLVSIMKHHQKYNQCAAAKSKPFS